MNNNRKVIAFVITLFLIQLTYGKSAKELFTFIQLTDTQMGFISGNKGCDEEIEAMEQSLKLLSMSILS